MPTYDYQCDACAHKFEAFQSISDPQFKKCPECGKLKLRRLFGTGAAVVFKGSGFYQTDYRSESYKAGAKADKKETSPSSEKTSSSSEKKSDAAMTSTKATTSNANNSSSSGDSTGSSGSKD